MISSYLSTLLPPFLVSSHLDGWYEWYDMKSIMEKLGRKLPHLKQLLLHRSKLMAKLAVEKSPSITLAIEKGRPAGINEINSLMIETVGYCNLRCKMCPINTYTTGEGLIEDSVFEKVLGAISDYDINIINMTGWGGPLLDLKLEERISQIRLIKPNVGVVFGSNGTLFTQRRIAQIFAAEVDTIYISFDAASIDTFEKIRINSNYAWCHHIVVNHGIL